MEPEFWTGLYGWEVCIQATSPPPALKQTPPGEQVKLSSAADNQLHKQIIEEQAESIIGKPSYRILTEMIPMMREILEPHVSPEHLDTFLETNMDNLNEPIIHLSQGSRLDFFLFFVGVFLFFSHQVVWPESLLNVFFFFHCEWNVKRVRVEGRSAWAVPEVSCGVEVKMFSWGKHWHSYVGGDRAEFIWKSQGAVQGAQWWDATIQRNQKRPENRREKAQKKAQPAAEKRDQNQDIESCSMPPSMSKLKR
jgi:hypothetical protein